MRIIKANGHVHVVIFDAASEDYEMRQTPLCMDSCPNCETTVTEEDAYCPECEVFILWENSKVFRKLHKGVVNQKRIEAVERNIASDFESVLLEALQCEAQGCPFGSLEIDELLSVWPEGTIRNVQALRAIEKVPDREIIDSNPAIIEWALKTSRQALSKMGKYGSPAANYLLISAINKLGKEARKQVKGRHIRSSRYRPSDNKKKGISKVM